MNSPERLNLVAACGIDCGICELYICKDNAQLIEELAAKGIPKEKLPCNGCRAEKGKCPILKETCDTYACVTEKKLDFCYGCNEFPCTNLNPSADRANVLPHNMKVFNLCKIKMNGLEEFVEYSTEIKRRYFKGKMVIGKGPQI